MWYGSQVMFNIHKCCVAVFLFFLCIFSSVACFVNFSQVGGWYLYNGKIFLCIFSSVACFCKFFSSWRVVLVWWEIIVENEGGKTKEDSSWKSLYVMRLCMYATWHLTVPVIWRFATYSRMENGREENLVHFSLFGFVWTSIETNLKFLK